MVPPCPTTSKSSAPPMIPARPSRNRVWSSAITTWILSLIVAFLRPQSQPGRHLCSFANLTLHRERAPQALHALPHPCQSEVPVECRGWLADEARSLIRNFQRQQVSIHGCPYLLAGSPCMTVCVVEGLL